MPGPSWLYFPREDSRRGLENIKDAISGYLASLRKHDEPIPPPIEEEVVEVGG